MSQPAVSPGGICTCWANSSVVNSDRRLSTAFLRSTRTSDPRKLREPAKEPGFLVREAAGREAEGSRGVGEFMTEALLKRSEDGGIGSDSGGNDAGAQRGRPGNPATMNFNMPPQIGKSGTKGDDIIHDQIAADRHPHPSLAGS